MRWKSSGILQAVLVATLGSGVAGSAASDVLVFPGAAPCATTLQACIDGAVSGDEIEIATNAAIDETLAIAKSLVLRAADGFVPVIGGGATPRALSLGSLGVTASGESVVIEGLTFVDARIDGLISEGSDHAIEIRDNVFEFELGNNNTGALNLDARVPISLVVSGNEIVSTGQGVRLWAILESGSVDYRIERNVITTSLPPQSNAGIYLDLRGSGHYEIRVLSNAVRGVGGCNCGTNGGIVLDVVADPEVSAFLNNNTADATEMADGVVVLVRDPGAELALNVFNNSVSSSDRSGFRVDNFGGGSVSLAANANNSYANGFADSFGSLSAGVITSHPPIYVQAASGDLRLSPGSLLIDAGVSAPLGGTASLDAAGAARIQGVAIDIGAYEAPEPDAAALAAAAFGILALLHRRRGAAGAPLVGGSRARIRLGTPSGGGDAAPAPTVPIPGGRAKRARGPG